MGIGRSIELETRIHRAARISAALSRDGVSTLEKVKSAKGRITVVRIIAFHEAPSIHINNVTALPVIAPQQIKTAYALSETFADFVRPGFFLLGQSCDEAEDGSVS